MKYPSQLFRFKRLRFQNRGPAGWSAGPGEPCWGGVLCQAGSFLGRSWEEILRSAWWTFCFFFAEVISTSHLDLGKLTDRQVQKKMQPKKQPVKSVEITAGDVQLAVASHTKIAQVKILEVLSDSILTIAPNTASNHPRPTRSSWYILWEKWNTKWSTNLIHNNFSLSRCFFSHLILLLLDVSNLAVVPERALKIPQGYPCPGELCFFFSSKTGSALCVFRDIEYLKDFLALACEIQFEFAHAIPLIWVNYNELTASSLEIIVSKGNHPQMALIQVSEL